MTTTVTQRLDAAATQAEEASGIMEQVAKGDAATEVAVPGGVIPSLRRWFAGLDDKVGGFSVSIASEGAEPAVDCADALIAAGAGGRPVYVPAGDYVASITSANAAAIFDLLNRIRLDGTLTLHAAAGTHALTAEVTCNSPDAQRIKILGATPAQTNLTSLVSATGASKAFSVTVGVASSAGAAVGDYALIRADVAGTGDFYAHAGIWKITGVNSGGTNRLTLLNTHHGAAFPVSTLTGGTVIVLKTVLQFTGCDGFRFEGGQPFGLVDNVAIVGDWSVASGTGTQGVHGVVIATPLIADGADSNAPFNMSGYAALGKNVGISAFGEQGVVVSGRGGLVANYVASCSNRKRGWYSEGGHIRTKLGIANGNGEDGYIADTTGFVQAALSIASGNGLNGFWSTNNSMLVTTNAKASGNAQCGFECRGAGRIGADMAIALNNGTYGFDANDGGMIDADSSTASGNANSGFRAHMGVIDCDNSTSTDNGGHGYRSEYSAAIRATGCTVSGNTSGNYYSRDGGVLFDSSGTVIPQDVPTYSVAQRIYNAAKSLYYQLSTTSIGDLVFSAGSTARMVLKSDGTAHPSGNLTQNLGRTTERWLSGYIRNLVLGSDTTALVTSYAGNPEGQVTAPPGSVCFRIEDGYTGSAIYKKLTGTGNTGWVEQISEAPADGKAYARKDGAWIEANGADTPVEDRGNVATTTSETVTLDISAARFFTMSMATANTTGTLTIAFSNVPDSTAKIVTWHVEIIRGGRKTISLPAEVKWAGGVAPVLGNTSSSREVIMFYKMAGRSAIYAMLIDSGTI